MKFRSKLISGKRRVHFDISDLAALKAVGFAALEVNVPVLVGVYEGEGDFICVHEIAALVRSIGEQNGFPIYVNADHSFDQEGPEAAQARFDLLAVFDGSALPFEENASKTRSAVTVVKAIDLHCGGENNLQFRLVTEAQEATLLRHCSRYLQVGGCGFRALHCLDPDSKNSADDRCAAQR